MVEFAFSDSFLTVDEWQTMDEFDCMEAETAEEAAKEASYADGFEKALFQVYELIENEFGQLEPVNPNEPERFFFD